MTAIPWRPDSSGLSTVVVRLIDYESMCSKARAYDRLLNDIFPLLILFSVVLAGVGMAAVYWYWRAKTDEEELACIRKPSPKPVYDPMAGVLRVIKKKMREGRRR